MSAMETIALNLTVNGRAQAWAVAPGERLSDALRRAGYLGVKVGCSTGDCGTGTVLRHGKPILACLMLAAQAQGAELITVEGLARGPKLHPIQEAFLDEGAVQCGFCSPAMILSGAALLAENPDPSEAQARECLSATLCRCTGYEAPVRAILSAAQRMKGEK